MIEDFSSPELLRVPLEKLILKIKVWDCGEPEKILGRAIQPPNIKHIESAVANLQNYGALTLKNEHSASGDLTELGKVYSEMPIDIKLSRLIMLGFAFGMIEPAIVTASVLSQEKSMFKKTNNTHLLYDIKSYFENNSQSDLVLCYNAFKVWETEFGRSLQKDEFDRRYHKYLSDKERKFCNDRFMNTNLLREIQVLVADLKGRMNKLGLYKQTNDSNTVDFSNDKNLTLFKMIIGGAFYGKYIKCQYADFEKLRRIKTSKSTGYKINQAITIKGYVYILTY